MADAPGEAILPAGLKDGYSTGGTVRLHYKLAGQGRWNVKWPN